MRYLRRARRTDAADERGFTLLETVIAITVLAGVFVSAAAVFSRMLVGTLYSRQNQQAADVISERIEHLRAQSVAAVAMDAADLAGDALITTDGLGNKLFDPDGTGPLAAEPVLTAEGAVVKPHRETVVRNHTTYTLSTYVSDPGDTTGKYRRITVLAQWTSGKRSHERRSSTFMTLTRRGLPLPNFTFTAAVTVTKSQGATVALPVTLTNRGATDAWNLGVTLPAGRTWTVQWYRDNGNGSYDTGVDVQLVDADGDARPETGLLGTDVPLQLYAVFTLSATETPTASGSPAQLTLTAQSVGQPSSPTGTAHVVDSINIQGTPAGCTGCTYRSHTLHNSSTAGNTTRVLNMPVDLLSPTATSLANYDTDVDAVEGRKLAVGGTNSLTTSSSQMANWRYQAPAKRTYRGNAVITLWMRTATGSSNPSQVTAYVNYDGGGSSYTNVGSATVSLAGGTTWQQVQFTVPVDFTLTKNKKFEVKLVATSGVGLDDVLLAYDTTTYPATIQMPEV
jgi:prepilin-type N-terminal cleavage/methylation domain-containing protein